MSIEGSPFERWAMKMLDASRRHLSPSLLGCFWQEVVTSSNSLAALQSRATGQALMAEARSSFSESSSADHPGGVNNDDVDEYEMHQRLEKIE